MFKSIVKISLFFFIVSSFIGCAQVSMDKKVKNKEARVIFFIDKSADEEELKKSLYDAISYRVSNLTENEGLLPEELPKKPGHPKINEQFKKLMAFTGGNGASAGMRYRSLDVSNAFYSVSGEGKMTSDFNNKAEYYKAAIYPYIDGYKVYIYLFYTEGTDGLIGSLTNAAVKSIVGNESALLFMAQVRDKFLEKEKNAKVLSQSPRKLEKIKLNAIGWDSSEK